MDALVFASYVPDKRKMYIIDEMFQCFEQYFKDADFYVGINGESCTEYINFLDQYKSILSLQYTQIPKHLEVASDVSAYQGALKMLKNSGKKYDYIWFGHTKGIVHNSSEWRYDFLNNFFPKRKEITELLKNSHAGSYSLYLTKYAGVQEFKDVLSKYYNFNKPYFFTYLYLFTFYVLKGIYVHNFLNNCQPEFFNNNLVNDGADIYMFERDFPQIVWRQGGYPLYKEWKINLTSGPCYPENQYYEDLIKYYD